MNPNPWVSEAKALTTFVGIGTLLGLITGHLGVGFGLGLAGFLVWHFLQLHRLERWLRSPRSRPEPMYGLAEDLQFHMSRERHLQRQKRAQLAKGLKQFRRTAGAIPDGMVLVTRSGEILWFNPQATELLGLYPGDLGHHLNHLIRNPEFLRVFTQGRGRDNANSIEIPSPLNERVTLEIRLFAVGKDQQLLVARDTSLVHRLQTMRKDFVANVSHELRTPLTVIIGYLETILDDESLTLEETRSLLEKLDRPAQRMRLLVEDLLLLSRLDTGTIPPADECPVVEFGAIVRAVGKDCEYISAGEHHFEYELAPQLKLSGIEQEIYSVASNLMNNAIRYTPAGGEIRVRWRALEDGSARFEVTDTGPGIEEQHLQRLTERFYRVDVGRSRQNGGTGLGLSIVKQVLRRHGAKLEVTSTLGEGSQFAAVFPASRVLIGVETGPMEGPVENQVPSAAGGTTPTQ
ncbi:MAG: phosphate regulon sensor histidine kinase PhoR [Pseudomonadota bacterium]|nr:phosphate regulon sensor histidine kinase PhoR [Pseudomonadota bacterium]